MKTEDIKIKQSFKLSIQLHMFEKITLVSHTNNGIIFGLWIQNRIERKTLNTDGCYHVWYEKREKKEVQ